MSDPYLPKFLRPTLTPVCEPGGKPHYASIAKVQLELDENSASVHSTGGDGRHGHLTLTMVPAKFSRVSRVPFITPVHPGPYPIHASTTTGPQISAANAEYDAALRHFRLYTATEQGLRAMLIKAVPIMYFEALLSEDMGFATVTTLQLLTHLWSTYGKITSAELVANLQLLNKPWAANTPIEVLLSQLARAARFADAGGSPIGDTNIILAGYTNIHATGQFRDACREWRRLPTVEQTLAAFQAHFQAADQDRLANTELETASTHGFHAANSVAPTIAPAVDFAHLFQQLAVSIDQRFDNLAAAAISSAAVPSTYTPPINGRREVSYCWSHGTTRNLTHNSTTCDSKQAGHKDAATARNKMGGSTHVYGRNN